MGRKKAVLIPDPERRQEQISFIRERVQDIQEFGDSLWVSITDDQATRFSEQGILVQFQDDADIVELPAVIFDPAGAEPEPPSGLTATPPAGENTAYYLVKFKAPPDPEWVDDIEDEEIGGSYVQDLPVNTSVFRLSASQAAKVRDLNYVSWAGQYHPAYALHYTLAGREEPYSAIELRNLQVDPSRIVQTQTGTLEISFFDDLASADMRALVEAAGATVRKDTGYSLIVDIAPEQVMGLLRIEGISAVEPYVQSQLSNQRAGTIINTDQVRNTGNVDFLVNLNGDGEIAAVIDSGLDRGNIADMHRDLDGRILRIDNLNSPANPNADTYPHGTHVVGSILGNGTEAQAWIAAYAGPAPNPRRIVRGMAPGARIIFYCIRAPTAANPDAFNFNNYLTGLRNGHNAGARVHNNSWGGGAINNLYTNAVSGVIDRFTFLHPESLVLFAAGNEEEDVTPANGILDMDNLTSESIAKNVLCIGASENVTNTEGDSQTYRQRLLGRYNHANFAHPADAAPVAGVSPMSDNADDVAFFSNRGRVRVPGVPVARRRVKPDLVAPGTNIISTGPRDILPYPAGNRARPNTAPPDFYYLDSGTSMATPITSGAALLTRQYYRAHFGQLRRPLLLERVNPIIDLPTIAPHHSGCIIAWIRRDAASGENHIAGARYNPMLVRQGDIARLQANVGGHPSPMLARHGQNTILLHRANDNTIRISLYDQNLAPVNTFGTNGTVTLSPASRSEDSRLPAMCVHASEVAVVWNETGSDDLLFQRLDITNGTKKDDPPKILGSMTGTSPHPYIIHNGNHYAIVWVYVDGADQKLQIRLVDNTGSPAGTQPITLITQALEIRAPHIVWDSRQNRFLAVWAGATNTHPGGDIHALFIDSNGNPVGTSKVIRPVPDPANRMRRPFIGLHPDTGYVLFWEDNSQNNHYDLYLAFLGNNADPDGRINGNRLRISDTPLDTQGFSCLVDPGCIIPVWQSNDEINSDMLGVYALRVTKEGAFQAQKDPNAPLLDSGAYTRHLLYEHTATDLTAVSVAWAGGNYFLLRAIPDNLAGELYLVHTNADGLPDEGFGTAGARLIDSDISYEHVDLLWANTRLIAAHTFVSWVRIFLFDGDGNRVNTFGNNGIRDITETFASTTAPQLGARGSGNNLRVFVAYMRSGDPSNNIRYAVLNQRGNFDIGVRDLARAEGTARHGWFHYIHSDTPRRSIAAWHRRVNGNAGVFINRYRYNGSAVHNTDIRLTTLAGDSQNCVIAPRPVLYDPPVPTPAASVQNSRRREYGVAWQYRPDPASAWEIRFSRLNRDGTVATTRDAEVISSSALPAGDRFHATEPQLVWHTNGYGLAWLQQPVSGGDHTLFFVVLDENGARIDLRGFGAAAAAPAPNHQISASGADVKDFKLVWNGRTFRITWTEVLSNKLRHMQTAIAVPRQAGRMGYHQPFQHPTSALIRATLINGATNIRSTALPNIGDNINDGYGWGRVNLRQSLAPSAPVTFHVRDDSSVASGRTIGYNFYLPPNTRLIRATLAWTDPPGNRLMNNLNLRITAPAMGADPRSVYVGNRWQAGGPPNTQFSDPLPEPPPANPFEGIHNIEQIVIHGNPNVPSGIYNVEVIGGPFRNNSFQQFPGQPFALVFVGSGEEVRFTPGELPPAGPVPVY